VRGEKTLSKILQNYEADTNGGCWLWLGCINRLGYGQVSRATYGESSAHRLFYTNLKEPIPIGMCILHKCDVPTCVNPQHLYVGNHSQNMKDMWSRGRHRKLKTHCKRGHPFDMKDSGRSRCSICRDASRKASDLRRSESLVRRTPEQLSEAGRIAASARWGKM